MRICFISHSAGNGGAERVLLETIELLQVQGTECRVIVPELGPFSQQLASLGIPFSVISYPLWMSRGKASFALRLKALLNLIKDTPYVAWKILWWRCDVVYSNTASVCVGAFAARIVGRPHLWHLHEFGQEDQGLSFLFGARCIAWIDRLSVRCICVSHALAKKYAKFIDPAKLVVLYPSMHRGLSDASKSIDEKTPDFPRTLPFRCVVVGALIEGKGQIDAVLAMAQLKRVGFPTELVIVGRGEADYRGRLEHLVQVNDLTREVSFVEHVENSLPLMRSADAVLICSKCEAFGRVTIEGMFSGTPVIGARSGATAELIRDGMNGLLYTPGDPADLAAKILHLLEQPANARELGRSAKLWVEKVFTRERYTEDLVAVLNSLSLLMPKAMGTMPAA